MIILGIVGNPASGKSTVCEMLQGAAHQLMGSDAPNSVWINADAIAKEVLQSDETRPALVERFGQSVLGASDEGDPINRAALAKTVFGDDATSRKALSDLEAIIHPQTRKRIRAELVAADESGVWLAILDVPLLFESDWDLACDCIWCVDTPEQSQIQWAASRGWPDGEVARRQANQISIREKQRLANVVLQNHGTIEDLKNSVLAHARELA